MIFLIATIGVGVRSQRCLRSSVWSSPGSGPLALAAILDSTFLSLRMPGMIVATSLLLRMKREGHFRHGHTALEEGLESVGVGHAGLEIFRDEISVTPIAFWPCAFGV